MTRSCLLAPETPTGGPFKLLQQAEWYVVRTGTAERPGGFDLLSGGQPIGYLAVSFHCAPDRENRHLAVRKSQFQLAPRSEGTPLLRVDFLHKSHSVPAAHWNVHAERGATSVLLARCNPKHSGFLSQVHLPVGGTRARPCLEDFLEMLICEFNIDAKRGWKERIHAGRERWRKLQARAIVRDVPEEAASVLTDLGYVVQPPNQGHPDKNTDMLRCR